MSLLLPRLPPAELFVEAWSSTARTVRVRGLHAAGEISFNLVTTADRALTSGSQTVPYEIITVSATLAETGVKRGETYVRVSLRSGGLIVAVLFAGYLTDSHGLTWPPGQFEASVSGEGFLRAITGTDPAAGVEISETVPTNTRWLILAIQFALVSDGAGSAIQLRLLYNVGADIQILLAPSTHGLSTSITYSAGVDREEFATNNGVMGMRLPRMVLRGGDIISTNSVNLGAGDDYGAPTLYVMEWLEE